MVFLLERNLLQVELGFSMHLLIIDVLCFLNRNWLGRHQGSWGTSWRQTWLVPWCGQQVHCSIGTLTWYSPRHQLVGQKGTINGVKLELDIQRLARREVYAELGTQMGIWFGSSPLALGPKDQTRIKKSTRVCLAECCMVLVGNRHFGRKVKL